MKIPLLVHGEIVDGGDKVDILDKERRFADTYVALAEQFPDLKIIMEHISTKELVDLVKNPSYKNLFATATLHHLLIIHNHILEGGTKPHNMCMPIPKLYDDRKALLREVLNGNPKIMFGSDSAPHPKENKESANGCCGCFTSPIALQALTEIFEYFGEVPKLQDFISGNAQRIYGDRLSLVNKNVVLRKADVIVPLYYSKSGYRVVPFMDGKRLSWDIYSII
jgi:dihydroorotase